MYGPDGQSGAGDQSTRLGKRAAALRYTGTSAPTVVAAGAGATAERIEQAAREAGVPVMSDGPLAEALARLPLDHEIPAELYRAVAEVLIWARGLDMLARAQQASEPAPARTAAPGRSAT